MAMEGASLVEVGEPVATKTILLRDTPLESTPGPVEDSLDDVHATDIDALEARIQDNARQNGFSVKRVHGWNYRGKPRQPSRYKFRCDHQSLPESQVLVEQQDTVAKKCPWFGYASAKIPKEGDWEWTFRIKRPGHDHSSQQTSKSPATGVSVTQTSVPSVLPAKQPKATKTWRPKKPSEFPLPKLRFEVRDVTHPGAARFHAAIDLATVFPEAVSSVLRLLYVSPSQRGTQAPPTRSVTLILEDMDGVAYTTGKELDDDHKEIHFSLPYIANIPKDPKSKAKRDVRGTQEITGVLTHELVHCYQYNGRGKAPGGLIEGVADWVRLRCDLSPPHWKKELDGKWDRGYQHTAFFLEYLEERYGEDTIRRLNEKLRTEEYKEDAFWMELLGKSVDELWREYVGRGTGDDVVENDFVLV